MFYGKTKRMLTTLLLVFLSLFAQGQESSFSSIKKAVRNKDKAVKLDLKDAYIHDDMHKLHKLKILKEIHFDNNDIYELPESLCKLGNLIKLTSRNNALKSLPECINESMKLSEIELYDTEIRDLTPLIHLSKLQKLTVFDNDIPIKIPEKVDRLTRLKFLNIVNSPLDTLPSGLGRLPNIEGINFFNCHLDTLPDLSSLQSLQVLMLEENDFETFPPFLYKMTQLKRLSLKNNNIRSLDENQIINLQQLETLDLRGNPISEYEVDVIRVLIPGCEVVF